MCYEFDGTVYGKPREMQEARRRKNLRPVSGGTSFTQAAKSAGVSKRTGKVWGNGRTRSTGRDERALVDWHHRDMEEPERIGGCYLSQDERIAIADGLRAGDSIRTIAARLGGSPSTVSREVRSNAGPTGGYGPHRAQQMSTNRLRRPKPRKIDSPRLRRAVREKPGAHWSPEQVSGWLRREFPDDGATSDCHGPICQAVCARSRGRLRRDIEGRPRPERPWGARPASRHRPTCRTGTRRAGAGRHGEEDGPPTPARA